jgi:uncharacterized protein with NRDE domain
MDTWHRTNITEPPRTFNSSRGSLVSSFLTPDQPNKPLPELVTESLPLDMKFAGFNLLLLSPKISASASNDLIFDAMFATNHGGGGTLLHRPLMGDEMHCGCFANGVDGQGGNEWPKVTTGLSKFSSVLTDPGTDTEDKLTNNLFDLLRFFVPTLFVDLNALIFFPALDGIRRIYTSRNEAIYAIQFI